MGARWGSAGGWAGQPPGGRRAGPHTGEVLSVPVPRDAEARPGRLASVSQSQRGRHRGRPWRSPPSPGGRRPRAAGAWRRRTRRTRSGSRCCRGSPGPSRGRALRGAPWGWRRLPGRRARPPLTRPVTGNCCSCPGMRLSLLPWVWSACGARPPTWTGTAPWVQVRSGSSLPRRPPRAPVAAAA